MNKVVSKWVVKEEEFSNKEGKLPTSDGGRTQDFGDLNPKPEMKMVASLAGRKEWFQKIIQHYENSIVPSLKIRKEFGNPTEFLENTGKRLEFRDSWI